MGSKIETAIEYVPDKPAAIGILWIMLKDVAGHVNPGVVQTSVLMGSFMDVPVLSKACTTILEPASMAPFVIVPVTVKRHSWSDTVIWFGNPVRHGPKVVALLWSCRGIALTIESVANKMTTKIRFCFMISLISVIISDFRDDDFCLSK